MKATQFENTNKLFEKIKCMGFLERLFGWKSIISLSMDSYNEFKNVDNKISELEEEHQQFQKRQIE